MIETDHRIYNKYNLFVGYEYSFSLRDYLPVRYNTKLRVYCRCCQTDIMVDSTCGELGNFNEYGYRVSVPPRFASSDNLLERVINLLGFVENGFVKCRVCSSRFGKYNRSFHYVVVLWDDKLGIIGIK